MVLTSHFAIINCGAVSHEWTGLVHLRVWIQFSRQIRSTGIAFRPCADQVVFRAISGGVVKGLGHAAQPLACRASGLKEELDCAHSSDSGISSFF